MAISNKENHDGIFKKISLDGSKRIEREQDLSPYPYVPKEKLKLMRAKTRF